MNNKNEFFSPGPVTAAIILLLILGYGWMFGAPSGEKSAVINNGPAGEIFGLNGEVLPQDGVVLPVKWGDLGSKLVAAGVIDGKKFDEIYESRGELTEEYKNLVYGKDNGNLKITPENSGLILNLLWALGLGNKNEILEKGPMADPRYGGAGNFASTGGWTLAKGGAMDHYSKHSFIKLTPEQQKLAEEVSKNIYRPCCGNPAYFPDCNHGMAMLALLELMASQGTGEKEMYQAALAANSYWFSDTYLTIAKYMEEKKNVEWGSVNPKEVLGYNYSSDEGYMKILQEVTPPDQLKGAGCGI